MPSSSSAAATRQLHVTLPDPDGAHGCLTLCDVCPHNAGCTRNVPRREDRPVLCDLPTLSSSCTPRTFDLINARSGEIAQIIRTSAKRVDESRCKQSIRPIASGEKVVLEVARIEPVSRYQPKEKHMSTRLATLVLSKHAPVMHHVREFTMTPPPRSTLKPTPSMPTIYLLTFSTSCVSTSRAFTTLLNEHLAPEAELRYTIDARHFLVPPSRICEEYSGVADVVQDEMLKDAEALQEIDRVVDDLTVFLDTGGHETCVAVCCTAGTHRSVAMAELIALGVRQEARRSKSGGGVKVVVRHVHRTKGRKDPF